MESIGNLLYLYIKAWDQWICFLVRMENFTAYFHETGFSITPGEALGALFVINMYVLNTAKMAVCNVCYINGGKPLRLCVT